MACGDLIKIAEIVVVEAPALHELTFGDVVFFDEAEDIDDYEIEELEDYEIEDFDDNDK